MQEFPRAHRDAVGSAPRQAHRTRTTVSVETVLEWMASGMTQAEILADYEDLEEADLLACLAFTVPAGADQKRCAAFVMKFLADAQLPGRPSTWLALVGHDLVQADYLELTKEFLTIHKRG